MEQAARRLARKERTFRLSKPVFGRVRRCNRGDQSPEPRLAVGHAVRQDEQLLNAESWLQHILRQGLRGGGKDQRDEHRHRAPCENPTENPQPSGS